MNTEEQIVLQRMIEIYKPGEIDWMGTKIKKNNPLTFHHIVKRKKAIQLYLMERYLLEKVIKY